MTVEVGDLIADKFFDDCPNVVPLNAAVVIEFIDEDGSRQIASAWTSDVPYYVLDGMVRSLLGDVLALPREFERRYAERKADEIEQDGD